MTSGWYLTNDKAVIMIAHRLKTVQKAERIFVLENGKPYSREYMKNLCDRMGFIVILLLKEERQQNGEFRSLNVWCGDIPKVIHQNAF